MGKNGRNSKLFTGILKRVVHPDYIITSA